MMLPPWPLLLMQLTLTLLPAGLLVYWVRRLPALTPTKPGKAYTPRFWWQLFTLGALLALPATFLSIPLRAWCESFATLPGASWFYVVAGRAFLAAAIPEELVKYLALALIIPGVLRGQRAPFSTSPLTPLIIGGVLGLGFALVENLYYLRGALLNPIDGVITAGIRSVTALPCHVFLGCLMGHYWGRAYTFESGLPGRCNRRLAAAALFLPILLHGLYDLPLLQHMPAGIASGSAAEPSGMGLALLTLAWLAAWTWSTWRTSQRGMAVSTSGVT